MEKEPSCLFLQLPGEIFLELLGYIAGSKERHLKDFFIVSKEIRLCFFEQFLDQFIILQPPMSKWPESPNKLSIFSYSWPNVCCSHENFRRNSADKTPKYLVFADVNRMLGLPVENDKPFGLPPLPDYLEILRCESTMWIPRLRSSPPDLTEVKELLETEPSSDNRLPSKLKYLDLGNKVCLTQLPELPNGLVTFICLARYENSHPIKGFPETLKCLIFTGSYPHELPRLPSHLTRLFLPKEYQHPLPKLPETLQMLAMCDSKHPPSSLPKSLLVLDMNNCNWHLRELPDSLEIFRISGNYVFPLPKFTKKLKEACLRIPNLYPLPDLPDSMETLELHCTFQGPFSKLPVNLKSLQVSRLAQLPEDLPKDLDVFFCTEHLEDWADNNGRVDVTIID